MKFEKKYLYLLAISPISALAAFFINNSNIGLGAGTGLGLGAVVAASVVGLAAGFLFKDPLFSVASYSAAFMGMSSTDVFPQWWYMIVAGIIHAFVVIALLNVFVGWGGKAGTMGFIAVNITILIFYFINPVKYYTGDPIAKITSYPIDLWIAGILAGITGIMLTILIREKAPGGPKGNDAVIGSAIVALLGAIVVPALLTFFNTRGLFNYTGDPQKIIVAIIASGTYAGMASRKILPKLYDFLIVGIILGILNLLLWPIFHGFGGRLGTIGLVSCAIWMAFIKTRKPPAARQT